MDQVGGQIEFAVRVKCVLASLRELNTNEYISLIERGSWSTRSVLADREYFYVFGWDDGMARCLTPIIGRVLAPSKFLIAVHPQVHRYGFKIKCSVANQVLRANAHGEKQSRARWKLS